MYQINLLRYGGQPATIYDQNGINTSVIGPKGSFELNEAGSVSFSLLPDHPLYNEIMPMESFIEVLDDGGEIFYGRVLQRSHPTLTGRVSFQCEGALTFLLDSEIPPDKKSGTPNGKTVSAEAFFNWCIDKHNEEVEDPRREFTVGIVSAANKSKVDKYTISSWTQTSNAIETYILNVYGGFLRVRPDGEGGHYIDWIEQYDTVNPQEIQVGVNMEDQTNQYDGSNMFTVIRPIGNDGLTLPEDTLDLYPEETLWKYGVIVKSIEFRSATTEAELRTQANEYIQNMHKTLFIDSSIQLVDMHYLDGTIPKIKPGDRFTNIHGLNGTEMIAFSMEIDFERVENTTLELKNPKSLQPDMTPEGNGHNTSKSSAKSKAKASEMALKYYKELDELATITVPTLKINVDNFELYAREKITEYANTFERISSRVDSVEDVADDYTNTKRIWQDRMENIEYDVETIFGTDLYQNRDFISMLSGKFEIWTDADGHSTVHLKNGAEIAVDDINGGTITVGELKNQVVSVQDEVDLHSAFIDTIEGSALWTQRDNITGVVGEFDVAYERVPDPDNPGQYRVKKTLIIKSGGGMKIERDGVQYGIYDDGNLTGGVLVQKLDGQTITTINGQNIVVGDNNTLEIDVTATQLARFGLVDPVTGELTGGMIVNKINDASTTTKIKGTRVVLGTDLDDDDLATWATDAQNGTGVFAKYLTVKSLTAQELTTVLANIEDADIGALNVNGPLTATQVNVDGTVNAGTVQVHNHLYFGEDFEFMLLDAEKSQDGNTLTIYKTDGSVITFSKAALTKISGSWSGATLTVEPSQTGLDSYTSTITTGLITDTTVPGSPTYHFTAYRQDNDAQQPTEIQSARTQYKLGTLSSTPRVVRVLNAAGTTYINGTATYTIPLTTLNAESNGTYSPSGSNVGFSEVTVNVPDPIVGSAFVKDGSTYYVSATKDGNEVATARKQIVLARSGTTVEIQDGRGTARPDTPSYTIPLTTQNITENGTYTPSSSYVGFSNVVVNVPIDYSKVKSRFKYSVNGGIALFYIESYYTDSSNTNVSISGSELYYHLGFSGTNTTTVRMLSANGGVISGTTSFSIPLENKTITENGTYTPSSGKSGFNQVTVNVPTSGSGVPDYSRVQSRFNVSSGQYYIESFYTNDSGTIIPVSGSNVNYRLALSGTRVQIQNTSGTKITNTSEYTIPLTTKTITENGTYTPASGNVGFSSVTVNVPQTGDDYSRVQSRFNVSSGQYYIESFYTNDSGTITPISGSNVNYRLVLSGTKVQIQNTSGTKITNTPEYTIPLSAKTITQNGTYTPDSGNVGFSSVTVEVPEPQMHTRFLSDGSVYYVEAYKQDGTSIDSSETYYTLYLNRSTKTVTIRKNGNIDLGDNVPSLTIPLTTREITSVSNATYGPTDGVSVGFSTVTVNIPVEAKTIYLGSAYESILPSDGYAALSRVNVYLDRSKFKTRFISNHYIETYIVNENGTVTNAISESRLEYKLAICSGDQNKYIEIQDTNGNKLSGTDNFNLPLYTLTINNPSAGVYVPAEGYIGYSKVTINTTEPDYSKVNSGFGVSNGQYYIHSWYQNDSGSSVSINGSSVNYKLGVNGNKVQIQNTNGSQIGATPELSLMTKTITQNGTYTPPSGYIGYSSVTVNISSSTPDYSKVKSRFNVSSGQYYIESFYTNDSGNITPISNSTTSYRLGLSGTKVQIQNSNGTKISNTPEFEISGSSSKAKFIQSNGYYIASVSSDDSVTYGKSQYKLGVATTAQGYRQVQIQTASGTQYANTDYYNIRLQQKRVTTNGVVQADSGYDGLQAVTVDVPATYSGYSDPRAKFYKSGGYYYIICTDGPNGGNISGSGSLYDIGVVGSDRSTVCIRDATGNQRPNTPTYTIPTQTINVESYSQTYYPSYPNVGFSAVYVDLPSYDDGYRAGYSEGYEYGYAATEASQERHSHSATFIQQYGYAASRKMIMYFKDNNGYYHAGNGGQATFWYHSPDDMVAAGYTISSNINLYY